MLVLVSVIVTVTPGSASPDWIDDVADQAALDRLRERTRRAQEQEQCRRQRCKPTLRHSSPPNR